MKINEKIDSAVRVEYDKLLNLEQAQVVREAEGPCLVLAGAGSGKTRVLTFRAIYLIEQGIPPSRICLLT
ncbi:MAG: UvrD-helicase domain-containing protein, partial [Candidatus Ratteibacteria bacterium]